jgi:hypothetical protein
MRYTLFSALLSVGVLIGCSHVQDTKRIPASVKDVGVIGPDGEVILYYKEGDYIIVKACDPNTILGMTPAEARRNCQGKSNKVPVEVFKEALRNLVSTDRLNVLKPLTPEEVEAYSKEGLDFFQMQALLSEIRKIDDFIANYGEKKANLERREELVKALDSAEFRHRTLYKINTEIEKAVNLIANQTNLTLTRANSDKNQFLYTVLSQFNPNHRPPCGLKGTVDERIKDCSNQLTSEKEGFILVTRTNEFEEVHKELSSELLWSARLPSTMNHGAAKKACSRLKEVAGITGHKWRLPSKQEYEQAEKNGIRKALPTMNYWFWSSTVNLNYSEFAWAFSGNHGRGLAAWLNEAGNSVRCVAR